MVSRARGRHPAGRPALRGEPHVTDVVLFHHAQGLARTVDGAELFLYPGSGHLVSDDGLGDYDEAATRLILQRSSAFLDRWK
jgi:hypothetical protein